MTRDSALNWPWVLMTPTMLSRSDTTTAISTPPEYAIFNNSPHHPHLATFPHHFHKGPVPRKGKDVALECDLAEVSFVAIVSRIEELLMR
jgi:hypothetical protein